MSVLINYVSIIEEPEWEILIWKLRWWQIKKVNVRIVFSYQIANDPEHYRIDYNDENQDVISCWKKPNKLLSTLGIDINDSEFWLQEQRELLRIFLNQFDNSVKDLLRCKPAKPKWYKLIV